MSKRKKTGAAPPEEIAAELPMDDDAPNESVTTRASVPPEVMKQAMGDAAPPSQETELDGEHEEYDAETTVNLVGDLPLPGRDDLDEPTVTASGESLEEIDRVLLQRKHLRGLLEALIFASDAPIRTPELAKLASAPSKQVKELLAELKVDYATRGIHLDEVAGGWVFRTSPQYAPFVRDLTKQKPVRLTRAQVETLAIIAYRQPITRPEIDDVRGVDTGPVLKLLLERDLVRILGKRDEPGRPMIYGTTSQFLEFFGLKSLKDLPTLREFTELSEESREVFEDELGESPDAAMASARDTSTDEGAPPEGADVEAHDASPPRESMRMPIGEQAVELGEEDLVPVDVDSSTEPHASDQDGPTLTTEAPPSEDE